MKQLITALLLKKNNKCEFLVTSKNTINYCLYDLEENICLDVIFIIWCQVDFIFMT